MSISFAEAASNLERICQDIDESEIDNIIANEIGFNAAKDALVKNVDRRINYLQYLRSQISYAEKERASWSERLARLVLLEERIKFNTVKTLQANKGLKFAGYRGTIVLTNSNPTVIVNDESLIPAEYKEAKMTHIIKKSLIKTAILKGESVDGARLERKAHIKILKESSSQ